MIDNANRFRVIDTGVGSAAYNMALDEAILLHVANGTVLPTIRFYAWDRPTVSIGYFQRVDRDVDRQRLQDRGFSLVRRMTGGRAVLHDKELTYSVIVPGDHPFAKASVVESYRQLSLGLCEGFISLGVQAEVVSLTNESERTKYSTLGSAACFDSPSWYELVVAGKKIAGSAQVRAHNGLLQHGSLLLDLEPDDLFDVLLFRSDDERARVRNEFDERAISVRQLTSRNVTYQEAKQAFTSGFAHGLHLELVESNVTEPEIQDAMRLMQEKYASDSWTLRR